MTKKVTEEGVRHPAIAVSPFVNERGTPKSWKIHDIDVICLGKEIKHLEKRETGTGGSMKENDASLASEGGGYIETMCMYRSLMNANIGVNMLYLCMAEMQAFNCFEIHILLLLRRMRRGIEEKKKKIHWKKNHHPQHPPGTYHYPYHQCTPNMHDNTTHFLLTWIVSLMKMHLRIPLSTHVITGLSRHLPEGTGRRKWPPHLHPHQPPFSKLKEDDRRVSSQYIVGYTSWTMDAMRYMSRTRKRPSLEVNL
jgi:hypothetical protein